MLRAYGYPLAFVVRRDFSSRYAPTALGLGWTIVQPLLFLLLYTLVFGLFLGIRFGTDSTADGVGAFALFSLAGLLPHLALVEGVQRAVTCLADNRRLLDEPAFPAVVMPTVGVISGTVTEAIGLTLLVGFAAVRGTTPSIWIVTLPLLVLLRVVFTLGLALAVSVLNVFLADIGQALGLLFTAWFFLTPIVYPATQYPEAVAWLARLNPMYHVVEGYRAALLGVGDVGSHLLALLAFAGVSVLVGVTIFRSTFMQARDFL